MRSNIVTEAGLPTRLGQWWGAVPFLTSCVVIVCGFIYLVCLLSGYDTFEEVCFWPSAVISRLQVYRIYTSIIFHGSLLHVMFNMLALVPLGCELERIMGSVRLFYVTILLASSNAIFHLFIALVAAHNPIHLFPHLMDECAIGFSGVIFSMIVIETCLSGIQSRSVFGLFNVPAKWYAWILLIVFQLLMTNISLLGHLCGILSGFAYTYGMFNYLIPGSSFFSAIESSLVLSSCVRRPRFIVGGSGSPNAGPLPSYSIPGNADSGSVWTRLSSWVPLRETTADESAQDSRFPGRGRTLGSTRNQAAHTAGPDPELHARLLDSNPQDPPLDRPVIAPGGARLSDGRQAAVENVAGAPVPIVRNQVQSNYNEEVKRLVAMGFEKNKVEVALSTAEGDPSLAVEILTSEGIHTME
ncbi:hypothetical protein AMTRI_Chr03g56210 [Amborella trichopoda]